MVRHAEADLSALAAFGPVYTGGRFDLVPLSAAGLLQAEQMAVELRDVRPRLVLASPYTRTLQTAAAISRLSACPLKVDLRLHDWLPVRDGTSSITHALVQEKIAEYERWDTTGFEPPGRTWETRYEMRARVMEAIRGHPCRPLIVVTHEAPIKSVTAAVAVPPASIHPLPSTTRGADPPSRAG
jgi:broad specificity phosphatase PhoE